MALQPYENIISCLSEDVEVVFPNDMGKVIIKKGVQNKDQEASATRSYVEINRWKTDNLQSSANVLKVNDPVVGDGGKWYTTNLPAKVDGKLYLVTPECATVGRKLEGRKDLITQADLIRAVVYTKGKLQYDLRKN